MEKDSKVPVQGTGEVAEPVTPVEPLPWLSGYQLVGWGMKGEGIPGPRSRRGALEVGGRL
jgi:hypothetical protein